MINESPLAHNSPKNWVEQYGDFLFNYAYSRVNHSDTAYDLVQDTFLAGLAGLKSFEGRSTVKTWLISILKRKIIDHYRKIQRRVEDNLIDKNFNENREASPFYHDGENAGFWKPSQVPNDWNFDAQHQLEKQELSAILQRCISTLPEKWSSVFTLRLIEELTSEQVCKELDITESNLWVIIHRAKIQLRECVEKNWIN